MKSVSLNAVPRTLGRRGGSKKLRQSGRIPAVIYGRGTQAQSLEVSARDMKTLMQHALTENLLVDLSVENDARPKRLALVQEIQHHPLDRSVLHVDFHEVAENEKVTIQVPVESTGEAAGVKLGGGVLEHVIFKIKVRALPKDLPEVITVDVTNLELGKTIHIGELQPPPGVEIVGDPHIPVVSVALPRTETEEAPAEAVAGAAVAPAGEVQMIKEKKEEPAAAAAPAKGAKGAAPEKPAAEKKK